MIGRVALISSLLLGAGPATAQQAEQSWRLLFDMGSYAGFILEAPATTAIQQRQLLIVYKPAFNGVDYGVALSSVDCRNGRSKNDGGTYYYTDGRTAGWAVEANWTPTASHSDMQSRIFAVACTSQAVPGALGYRSETQAVMAYRAGLATMSAAPQPAAAAGPLPTALGREFQVTRAMVTQDTEDYFRPYLQEVVLRGRAGDRFRIAWRGSEPLSLDCCSDDYETDYPDGQTLFDLSGSVTITLSQPGDHILRFSQTGIDGGIGSAPRPTEFQPYYMTIRKLD